MKYHYKYHDLNQSVGLPCSCIECGRSWVPASVQSNQRLLNWDLLALCERSDFSFRELKRCGTQLREVNDN